MIASLLWCGLSHFYIPEFFLTTFSTILPMLDSSNTELPSGSSLLRQKDERLIHTAGFPVRKLSPLSRLLLFISIQQTRQNPQE
jgi:hypothetical protein